VTFLKNGPDDLGLFYEYRRKDRPGEPNVHLARLDRMVIQSVEGRKIESVIQTREFSNAVSKNLNFIEPKVFSWV
jgi:hypothetical protein